MVENLPISSTSLQGLIDNTLLITTQLDHKHDKVRKLDMEPECSLNC